MTNHAVTAQAAHATLEDLGYKTYNKKRTGHTGYRWMGRETCPKCNPPETSGSMPKPPPAPKSLSEDRRRKGECGHFLASDNPGPVCRPCARKKAEQLEPKQDKRKKDECKNGHAVAVFGPRLDWGECRECKRLRAKSERKAKAKEEGRSLRQLHTYLWLGKLNHFRVKKGVTWPFLAMETDISTRMLKDYSAEKCRCPPERAQVLADYFGVSVEELKGEG